MVTLPIGSALRDARRRSRLSQELVAEACGVTRCQITNIELGNSNASWQVAEAWAAACGLKLSTLIRRAERMAEDG